MAIQTNKQIIISVGGSLIVPPEGIDWQFLKKIRHLILEQTKKGWRFFLVAGGGVTARNYIAAADKIVKVTDDDRDWLGIHSTRLNAHLLRTIFRRQAYPEIIKNPTIHFPLNKPVLIAGGWKPGWSTDYVATIIAQEYEIKTIINLSNINYAYTADPRQNQNAKKIEKINWSEFRKLVGNKWSPGLNTPFDPIASAKAQQLGLTVVIMNGHRLKNLKHYLTGQKFIGTVIAPNKNQLD
jgi:uridylate kinase